MMAKVIHTSDAERKLSSGSLRRVDEALSVLPNKIQGWRDNLIRRTGRSAMKKLVICAGPTAVGKTSVLRHVIRKLLAKNIRVAYLKNDVQYATDAVVLAEEFGIPTATEYSGEFCPDYGSVTTLYDHIRWAWSLGTEVFLVETAGLCLRCALTRFPGKPWDGGTRRNERHRSSIQDRTDAHPRGRGDDYEDRHGISGRARDFSRSYPKSRAECPGFGSERPSRYRNDLVTRILKTPNLAENGFPTLRGHPPLGTCTVCSGERSMNPNRHRGVVAITGGGTRFSGQ